MAETVERHSAANLSVYEDDGVVSPDECLLWGRLKNSEMLGNLESLFGHLSKERCIELPALINNYLWLFDDVFLQGAQGKTPGKGERNQIYA